MSSIIDKTEPLHVAHPNDMDVTGSVCVSDPEAVKREVLAIMTGAFSGVNTSPLEAAFTLFAQVYQGRLPGYLACDTLYHDLQHSLDITLTTARLLKGYQKIHGTLSEKEMLLGIITALYHDVGYIRRSDDHTAKNGAEYTLTHVSRGAEFMQSHLPLIGLADTAERAKIIVHLTGYEKPPGDIVTENPVDRLVGDMVATADLITQMADRCYLEKCRDRLFPEFVLATANNETPVSGLPSYASPEALLFNTPDFYRHYVRKRLENDFKSVFKYADAFFNGPNYYIEKLEGNIQYLEKLIEKNDLSELHRRTPENHGTSVFPYEYMQQLLEKRKTSEPPENSGVNGKKKS
ncbi:MAG TPA: HD domain-containing protein [Gammaproteobacteria bacterium]